MDTPYFFNLENRFDPHNSGGGGGGGSSMVNITTAGVTRSVAAGKTPVPAIKRLAAATPIVGKIVNARRNQKFGDGDNIIIAGSEDLTFSLT